MDYKMTMQAASARCEGGAVSRGGYSPQTVGKSGKHGCAGTPDYERHQVEQAAFRETRLSLRIDLFLARERREWTQQFAAVRDRLAVQFDRAGAPISAEEAQALRERLARERNRYRRPDGRWEKLRSRKVRKEGAKKVRVESAPEAVKSVYHEAFLIDPRLSRMLVLAAADETVVPVVHEYIRDGAFDTAELFEKHTGLEVHCIPYHAKAFAGHYQPDFAVIDANGRKLGSAKVRHLGPAMCGTARWRAMGIRGDALDALTGFPDSDAGLDESLAKRGDGVDYRVQSQLDTRMHQRLANEKYAVLMPYYHEAQRVYNEYLERRRSFLATGSQAEPVKSEKTLETAKADNELMTLMAGRSVYRAIAWVQARQKGITHILSEPPADVADLVEWAPEQHVFGWGFSVLFQTVVGAMARALGPELFSDLKTRIDAALECGRMSGEMSRATDSMRELEELMETLAWRGQLAVDQRSRLIGPDGTIRPKVLQLLEARKEVPECQVIVRSAFEKVDMYRRRQRADATAPAARAPEKTS